MRVRIVASAKREMDEIWRYWCVRVSEVTANGEIGKIVRGIHVVAMQPGCAKSAEEAPGYLRIGAESYVIYFRKFRDEMRVEHVVRAERDRKRLARGWKPGRE